ncbi:MAG: hypothetical protein Q8P15_03975 [Nanoarchaeota archaeon]|nr:hypothetical protein [Nanoarchaeota archaeon]
MEMARYQSESNPPFYIEVPLYYAREAGELVKILQSESVDKYYRGSNPFLSDRFISERARDLSFIGVKHPQSKKLRDEIYLRACLIRNRKERGKIDVSTNLGIEGRIRFLLGQLEENG